MRNSNVATIYSMDGKKVVTIIDYQMLHKYIVNVISREFANLVEDCYYPKISLIYKDLLHMTQSNEADLKEYSAKKYPKWTFKLLHDPYTTLLIIIVQEFLKINDISAAESAFHLFTLRHYTNLLHKYTTKKPSSRPLCVPEYFKAALSRISKNHMFSKKQTISNSIMYYSRETFQKYLPALKKDAAELLFRMIYELRTKLNQSMQSFFDKYYKAAKDKNAVESKDEESYDESYERKMRAFASKIAKDICLFRKTNESAVEAASSLIKFNKKLSAEYAHELSNPGYLDNVELAIFLLVKDIKDVDVIKSNQFLDYVKRLMSIKVTKQPLYFKKVIATMHETIIVRLKIERWYANLSIQSKAISRNFIAYYLAFYIRSYF